MSEYKTPREQASELTDEELLEEWDDLHENEEHNPLKRGAWIAATNVLGWELSVRGIYPPFHADFFREFSEPEFDPYMHIKEKGDKGERKAAIEALREAMQQYGAAMFRRGLRVGRGDEVRREDEMPNIGDSQGGTE